MTFIIFLNLHNARDLCKTQPWKALVGMHSRYFVLPLHALNYLAMTARFR